MHHRELTKGVSYMVMKHGQHFHNLWDLYYLDAGFVATFFVKSDIPNNPQEIPLVSADVYRQATSTKFYPSAVYSHQLCHSTQQLLEINSYQIPDLPFKGMLI